MTINSVSVAFHLGPKGRVVLPVAVRRAAEIADGADLVARAAGEGRIVIETVDAIRSRVWAAAAPEADGFDAAAAIRAARVEDSAIAARASARRSSSSSAEAGETLLKHLGL